MSSAWPVSWASDRYESGQRSIVFLRQEKGVGLRPVSDISGARLPYFSGKQSIAFLSELAAFSPEVQVARWLLTPGEGVDPRFVSRLASNVDVTWEVAGSTELLLLLRELVEESDEKIAAAACERINQYPFFGEYACLESVPSTAGRSKIGELSKRRNSMLIAVLEGPPESWFQSDLLGGLSKLDTLRMLSYHRMGAVRDRVCMSLRAEGELAMVGSACSSAGR